MSTTLNGKPIDESFGTTIEHIRNIPVIDATNAKATGTHRRRKNGRVVLSYDYEILKKRVEANLSG